MKVLSAVVGSLFVVLCAGQSQVTETMSTTMTLTLAIPTSITQLATETATGIVTISLPYSTFTSLVSADTPTVTVTGGGADVTVTAGSGSAGSTVTVAAATVTTTVGGGNTVTVTGGAAATVTTTVLSGVVTVMNCLPTTYTVVSSAAIPTPVSPTGTIVVYSKQKCDAVVCPNGRATIMVGGVAKACVLTMYGQTLVSSTCIVNFCCATKASSGSKNVLRQTTCQASGTVCPSGSTALTNTAGVSVPCILTYSANKLVETTCNTAVCCSAASAPTTGGTVSCKAVVKCNVYNKDPSTNYILRCPTGSCTTATCCQKVSDDDDDKN